jgi:hypothetical protein
VPEDFERRPTTGIRSVLPPSEIQDELVASVENIQRLLTHTTADFADVGLDKFGWVLVDVDGCEIREVCVYHIPNFLWEVEEMSRFVQTEISFAVDVGHRQSAVKFLIQDMLICISLVSPINPVRYVIFRSKSKLSAAKQTDMKS